MRNRNEVKRSIPFVDSDVTISFATREISGDAEVNERFNNGCRKFSRTVERKE